jgi:hypothetical protein
MGDISAGIDDQHAGIDIVKYPFVQCQFFSEDFYCIHFDTPGDVIIPGVSNVEKKLIRPVNARPNRII